VNLKGWAQLKLDRECKRNSKTGTEEEQEAGWSSKKKKKRKKKRGVRYRFHWNPNKSRATWIPEPSQGKRGAEEKRLKKIDLTKKKARRTFGGKRGPHTRRESTANWARERKGRVTRGLNRKSQGR